MKILALDSSTRYMALGLLDGNRVCEYDMLAERKLSSLLGPSVRRVIEALSWKMKDIDYLACGVGPGSFTAVRIGMSFMKGLAWSLRKPVAGISTLDSIAGNAPASGYIVPVMDAKRDLVYAAVYEAGGHLPRRVSPYLLADKDGLFKAVKKNVPRSRKETVTFLGDGLDLLRNDIPLRTPGAVLLDRDYWYPRGHVIIELARERIRAKKLSDAFTIKPVYLYPKECQIRIVK